MVPIDYDFLKVIVELGYNGPLEYFPQGGTCVPCIPFCALIAPPCRYGPCAGCGRLCLGVGGAGMV